MFSATTSSSNVSSDIRIASFNCHGLKSTMEYTAELSSENHVTFLCEHWLLPNGIHTICDAFNKLGKTSFFKSSVDPLVPLRGRPYGGLALSVAARMDILTSLLNVNQIGYVD